MIVYASTKMDISNYIGWFKNRLKDGFFDKEINEKIINRYKLEDIEKIVLYTRNPSVLYKERDFFSKYKTDLISFISMYDSFIEPNIKNKEKIILSIKKCKNYYNNYLGYGPVFFTDIHNKQWHLQQFEFLCSLLSEYIKGIYISFNINTYCQNNKKIKAYHLSEYEQKEIMNSFQEIADKYKLQVFLMKSESSFSDDEIDVGLMNCCPLVCEYCSFINNKKAAKQKYQVFDEKNTLLYGIISKGQKIKEISLEKKVETNEKKIEQIDLFSFL